MTTLKLTVKPSVVALMVLMAATRFHHFGTPWALPDASLAIFFFAGLWRLGRRTFALLLIEAIAIDYAAIHELGVSDYCISPAYVFLLPTYATMWIAGCYCQRFTSWTLPNLARHLLCLLTATTLAFSLSNTSFYVLSSQIAAPSWMQFMNTWGDYYPAYLSSTLTYGIFLWLAAFVIDGLRNSKGKQQIV